MFKYKFKFFNALGWKYKMRNGEPPTQAHVKYLLDIGVPMNPRQRNVALMYGFMGFTVEQIANDNSVTRERIRQLLRQVVRNFEKKSN